MPTKEQQDHARQMFIGGLPPRGTPAYEAIKNQLEKSRRPEHDKLLKQLYRRTIASRWAQERNGVGYPIDKLLRYYCEEYSHRAITAGHFSYPTSFEFVEAFLDYHRKLQFFYTKPESNYLCSFEDFLDWSTLHDLAPDKDTIWECTEAGRIYFYSNTSNPIGLQFRCTNAVSFAVTGVALVRGRRELVMLLQLATSENLDPDLQEPPDLAAQRAALREVNPFAAAQKDGLELDSRRTHERVGAPGLPGYYESIAMVRYDMIDQAILQRAIYFDWGDMYSAQLDWIQAFGAKSMEEATPKQRQIYDITLKNLEGYQEIFELSRHFALLPCFSSAYATNILAIEQTTGLRVTALNISERKLLAGAVDQVKVFSRRVERIVAPRDQRTSRLVVKVPGYRFQDRGYWQMLQPWEAGVDADGLPEQGRTWIQTSRGDRTGRDAHSIQSDERQVSPAADRASPSYGFIYVMRSAQHERDVFKVGLTARSSSKRSAELTGSTSSVDQFSVMQEWEVTDCYKAEKAIHARLAAYRVNPRREFFRCDYRLIFATIHEVVEQVNGTFTT